MKPQQTEALRLADALEQMPGYDWDKSYCEAATELRRLHAENEALKRVIENCKVVSDATAEGWRHDQAKFDTTAALNAELLEALKKLLPMAEDSVTQPNLEVDILDARAAIAKAEEQK